MTQASTPSTDTSAATGRSFKSKPWHWVLAGILLLAFIARMVLVKAGLPLLLYEDEAIYFNNSLNFGLGEWVIPYFRKPPFFLYLYGGLYYLVYLLKGFNSWQAYVNAFWENPTLVATAGRALSVCFAAGSVLLVGLLGRRAFSVGVGLAAAFLLAVNPTHLRISPIVISDIPALFFVLASAWFGFLVYERGRLRDYLLCALMVTLAISFKYNAFSVFFLLSAHLLRPRDIPITQPEFCKQVLLDCRLWLALGLIPLAFLILNPMILADPQRFWIDLNWEKRHMLLRNPQSTTQQWQFMVSAGRIFTNLLPRSLSWPLYILSLLGLPWMLYRYRARAVVLLSFAAVFLMVVTQFRLINAKYLLPLFPFLFLSAAVFMQDALAGLRRRFAPDLSKAVAVGLYTVLMTLLALPAVLDSSQYVAVYRRVDTRTSATAYIQKITLPSDRVFLEPETITLNNRIYNAVLVVADRRQHGFSTRESLKHEMARVDLSAVQPRYVLINFSEAQKQRDAHGNVQYQMPYDNSGYYRLLARHYQVRKVFAPYTVFLDPAEIAETYQKQGLGPLYAKIQASKTIK